MTLVATPAIVLHVFDYRETSRVARFLTRDAGVVSVLARGARRPRARSGAGLDLLTLGTVQFRRSATGDLHALVAFDVERQPTGLAASLPRFAAAAALAEVVLRVGADDDRAEGLFAVLDEALTTLAATPAEQAAGAGLAAGWRLIGASGHEPVLDACAHCHAPVPDDDVRPFHARAGGVLCDRCAARATGRIRQLPATPRATIRAWLAGDDQPVTDPPTVRAHQRLLREFLEEHLTGDRPLRAFGAWERPAP